MVLQPFELGYSIDSPPTLIQQKSQRWGVLVINYRSMNLILLTSFLWGFSGLATARKTSPINSTIKNPKKQEADHLL